MPISTLKCTAPEPGHWSPTRCPVRHALIFGIALGLAAFGWLWATTNLLSAALAIATILFYVFVYTLLLKRRTAQNIIWGGAAGCMPVVIGWSAVTGTVALARAG